MASELPIVTQTQGYAVSDWAAAKEQGRKEGCAEVADIITELTEALREARRLICSGEQSDAVYHVHVARAAAIIDAAIAKAGGTINE